MRWDEEVLLRRKRMEREENVHELALIRCTEAEMIRIKWA